MDKQEIQITGISIGQYNLSNEQWQRDFNKENLGIHQAPNDLAQNYYEIIQSKINR